VGNRVKCQKSDSGCERQQTYRCWASIVGLTGVGAEPSTEYGGAEGVGCIPLFLVWVELHVSSKCGYLWR